MLAVLCVRGASCSARRMPSPARGEGDERRERADGEEEESGDEPGDRRVVGVGAHDEVRRDPVEDDDEGKGGDGPWGGEPGGAFVDELGPVVEVLQEPARPGELGREDREPEGPDDRKSRARKGGDEEPEGENDDADGKDDDLPNRAGSSGAMGRLTLGGVIVQVFSRRRFGGGRGGVVLGAENSKVFDPSERVIGSIWECTKPTPSGSGWQSALRVN